MSVATSPARVWPTACGGSAPPGAWPAPRFYAHDLRPFWHAEQPPAKRRGPKPATRTRRCWWNDRSRPGGDRPGRAPGYRKVSPRLRVCRDIRVAGKRVLRLMRREQSALAPSLPPPAAAIPMTPDHEAPFAPNLMWSTDGVAALSWWPTAGGWISTRRRGIGTRELPAGSLSVERRRAAPPPSWMGGLPGCLARPPGRRSCWPCAMESSGSVGPLHAARCFGIGIQPSCSFPVRSPRPVQRRRLWRPGSMACTRCRRIRDHPWSAPQQGRPGGAVWQRCLRRLTMPVHHAPSVAKRKAIRRSSCVGSGTPPTAIRPREAELGPSGEPAYATTAPPTRRLFIRRRSPRASPSSPCPSATKCACEPRKWSDLLEQEIKRRTVARHDPNEASLERLEAAILVVDPRNGKPPSLALHHLESRRMTEQRPPNLASGCSIRHEKGSVRQLRPWCAIFRGSMCTEQFCALAARPNGDLARAVEMEVTRNVEMHADLTPWAGRRRTSYVTGICRSARSRPALARLRCAVPDQMRTEAPARWGRIRFTSSIAEPPYLRRAK